MKRYVISIVALCLLLIPMQAAMAQPPYTDGPLWRMVFMRSKTGQLDNYVKNFKERTLPAIVEEKQKGLILDFKFFINTKKENPQDWDIIIAYQFKDQAAYDAFLPINEDLETKVVGGPEGRKLTSVQRDAMKETLRTVFVKEINPK